MTSEELTSLELMANEGSQRNRPWGEAMLRLVAEVKRLRAAQKASLEADVIYAPGSNYSQAKGR